MNRKRIWIAVLVCTAGLVMAGWALWQMTGPDAALCANGARHCVIPGL